METVQYLTQFPESGWQSYAVVAQLKWKDPEEFYEKYWTSNPETFPKVNFYFWRADLLGYLISKKHATAETIFDLGGWYYTRLWEKYSECINWRRQWPTQTLGRDYMKYFEFLAQEMEKVGESRDANYRDRLEAYRRTLKS